MTIFYQDLPKEGIIFRKVVPFLSHGKAKRILWLPQVYACLYQWASQHLKLYQCLLLRLLTWNLVAKHSICLHNIL